MTELELASVRTKATEEVRKALHDGAELSAERWLTLWRAANALIANHDAKQGGV